MKNSLISIIVPIYNVEKYLEKCVRSLINQTYDNIEILLIDDGSTDNSGKIADSLADNKIVFSFHKENGGLSDARNYGIRKSKGEYLTFFDSDDFASKDFIKALYDAVEEYDADYVISGLKDFYDGEEIIEDDYNKSVIKKITKEECYKKMLMQEDFDISATAKLYSRSLFNSIEFPVGYFYEDFEIFDSIIEKSNNIYFVSYRGYNYLQRRDSIMYGNMSEKRLSLIKKSESIILEFEKKYPSLKKYAIKRYIKCNFHLLGRSVLDKKFNNISKMLRNNILNYASDIKRDYYLYSKKEKIALYILKMGIFFYKIFWKLYCTRKGKI